MYFQEGTKTLFSPEVLCEDDCPFLKVEYVFSFGPRKTLKNVGFKPYKYEL